MITLPVSVYMTALSGIVDASFHPGTKILSSTFNCVRGMEVFLQINYVPKVNPSKPLLSHIYWLQVPRNNI